MPEKPARRCPRCRRIVRGKCGCTNVERGSATKRGYGGRWRRFANTFLAEHPLCIDCGGAATDVHHIVKVRDDKRTMYDESNCLPLCHECHSVRTRRGE